MENHGRGNASIIQSNIKTIVAAAAAVVVLVLLVTLNTGGNGSTPAGALYVGALSHVSR
jgi:hypothetical protein